MKNIIIGTAGWRMPYGNSISVLSEDKIRSLVEFLKKNNISHLDTASNYADVEKIIFNLKDPLIKIDTKIQTFNDKEEFESMLNKKRKLKIDTLYFHDPNIFQRFDSKTIKRFVSQINDCGFKAGFSVYDQNLIGHQDFFISKNTLQGPVHIFDLSFAKIILEMKRTPESTYLRSFFARGLLFLEDKVIEDTLGKNFAVIKNKFEDQFNINFNTKNLLALTFSLIRYLVENDYKCILGMHSSKEVKNFLKEMKFSQFDNLEWGEIIMSSKKIIDIRQIKL